MTLGERIKKARKALDLTQQKFADQIGTTQNGIASYEIGRREPSAAVINNICKTFNVSEAWLRTGEGEMFIQRTRDEELASLMGELLAEEREEFRRRVIAVLLKLTPAQWDVLESIVQNLIDELDECSLPPISVDPSTDITILKPMTDAEIEVELENYRRELLAEREAGARSSASPKPGA